MPEPEYVSGTGPELSRERAAVGLPAQISNEMVRAQKEFFGKGPKHAKSYLLDDFLLIVMRGGLTVAETTMLEAGKEDLVRNFRQEYENMMTERLVGKMEELTARKIVTYQSQILFNPNIVVEIFFFDEADEEQEQERATVRGQVVDEPEGGASEDLLEG